ncbi:MAG: hypothetical protein FJ030_10160 [Chloroflexi bacterium]|nr:hypothetical protein [Chloroflexota bacterium]
MADTRSIPRPRRNVWALASLWLGVFGLALALTAPIPFVPLISAFTWPLGFGAMMTGWAGRRAARSNGDATAGQQSRWGIRLGCLGWAVQVITSIVKMMILAGMITYAASRFFNGTPTP